MVKQNGLNLKLATENLRDNEDIVEEAINQNISAIQYASDRVKKLPEIVKKVLKQPNEALGYLPDEIITNEICHLIVSWINRFKYGDVDDIEYQKQIIDTFTNAIYIFDDKLVFTYNFKDGTEAIPLKAVEDAFGSDLTQVAPPNPRNPNIIPVGDGFGFLLFIRKIEHTQ